MEWPLTALVLGGNGNLLNAALMATALKRGLEELVHYCGCRVVVDESARHYEHVGVVVLAYEVGYLWNPRQSGANALMLVERHVDSFAAAADANARIYLAALNAAGEGVAEVAVVAARVAVCAVVLVGKAVLFEILYDEFFQWIAGVVAGYAYCLYFHGRIK